MDNQVIDNGDLRKYRIEIPNLIDDMDLDVYEFRLYVHLKRVAGQEGACWQSTRTLSKVCKMSVGKISDAKKTLAEKGLIELQHRKSEQGETDYITIIDVWPQNFARYSRCSQDEQPVHVVNTPVHEVNAPVHVVKQRSNQYKKEPREEEAPSVLTSTGDPYMDAAQRKWDRKQNGLPVSNQHGQMQIAEWNLEMPAKPRRLLAEAIATATGKLALWNAGDDKLHVQLHEAAIKAHKMGYTPERVARLTDAWRDNWRAKGGGSVGQYLEFLSEQTTEAPKQQRRPRLAPMGAA